MNDMKVKTNLKKLNVHPTVLVVVVKTVWS